VLSPVLRLDANSLTTAGHDVCAGWVVWPPALQHSAAVMVNATTIHFMVLPFL
jgi:hypothetical protein